LISKAEANAWADEVWLSEKDEEEIEDVDRAAETG
jgi:hypothetical protein